MNLTKLKKQMHNVPFGQSCFQIESFSRGSETKERLYRNSLLQVNQKMRILKECEFRRARLEIDIEETQYDLENSEGLKTKRLKIDLEEKQYNLDEEIKLIEDCMIELKTYVSILEKLPKFTREQFENAERGYWEKRLLNDLRNEVLSVGFAGKDTIASLQKIGIIVGKNEQGQLSYTK